MGVVARTLVACALLGLSNKSGARRKKLPVLDGYAEEPLWEPPLLAECEEDQLSNPVEHPLFTVRISQRFRRYQGRLVDFAIILEVQDVSGLWVEASKIDCCHAQVHLHQRYRSRKEDDTRVVIRDVKDETDITESVDLAIDRIYDDFEEHLRKWSHGG